jgi:hypothetical protein
MQYCSRSAEVIYNIVPSMGVSNGAKAYKLSCLTSEPCDV